MLYASSAYLSSYHSTVEHRSESLNLTSALHKYKMGGVVSRIICKRVKFPASVELYSIVIRLSPRMTIEYNVFFTWYELDGHKLAVDHTASNTPDPIRTP